MVQVRDSARHWLEPVARARRRFAPGAGNLVVELRFLCAAAHSGGGAGALRSVTRRPVRGGAPVGAARSLGAVVPWTVGSGWPPQWRFWRPRLSLATVAVLIQDGLRDLGPGNRRAVIFLTTEVSTNRCVLSPWPRISPTRGGRNGPFTFLPESHGSTRSAPRSPKRLARSCCLHRVQQRHRRPACWRVVCVVRFAFAEGPAGAQRVRVLLQELGSQPSLRLKGSG